MKRIGRRFTWKFIGYFSLLYVLINVALLSVILYAAFNLRDEIVASDLHFETTDMMQTYVHLDGKKTTISSALERELRKNDAILLIRDENNKTVKTFNANEEVKNLSWYYGQDITTWSLTPKYQAVLIDRKPIVQAAELFDLRKTKELQDFMDANNIGLFKQRTDKDELTKIYGSFPLKEVQRHWFEDRNGENFNPFIYRETMRDDTYYLFVAENPNVRDKRIIFDQDGVIYDKEGEEEARAVLKFYSIFSLLILLLILMLALFVGRRLTRPLLHFIRWIEQLKGGDYKVPDNPKIYRKGTLRRKYKMYQSVDDSIKALTDKLQADEDYQQRITTLRDEWVAGITHDLKNPLSSIYGYSKLLNSGVEMTSEERKKFAEIIEAKAMDIDAMLKDLNMTYQMKNSIIEYNKEPVDIFDYLQTFAAQFNDKRVSTTDTKHGLVMLDVERMNRVLTNIVSNALNHNSGNSDLKVWISSYQQHGEMVIEVTDNGKGIDKRDLPYIFDQYYRGSGTGEREGSGLGLSVSKQIIESHDGYIEVSSSLAGTKFLIHLPLVE